MSSLLTDEVRNALNLRSGLNIILTVGNIHRKDDGIGPFIASQLVGLVQASGLVKLKVIDAGQTPENDFDTIVTLNPANILIIDAADFGGQPGEVRLISKQHLSDMSMSTHMFPIRAIWELLEAETTAMIQAIGIQVVDCGIGEGLFEAVREAAGQIADALTRICQYQGFPPEN